jgi:hypothetical protein
VPSARASGRKLRPVKGFSGTGSVVTLCTADALAMLATGQLLAQRERRVLE